MKGRRKLMLFKVRSLTEVEHQLGPQRAIKGNMTTKGEGICHVPGATRLRRGHDERIAWRAVVLLRRKAARAAGASPESEV